MQSIRWEITRKITGTPLTGPRSLALHSEGDLWLVTREGKQLLRFDLAEGRIWHKAGTGQTGGEAVSKPQREPGPKVTCSPPTRNKLRSPCGMAYWRKPTAASWSATATTIASCPYRRSGGPATKGGTVRILVLGRLDHQA